MEFNYHSFVEKYNLPSVIMHLPLLFSATFYFEHVWVFPKITFPEFIEFSDRINCNYRTVKSPVKHSKILPDTHQDTSNREVLWTDSNSCTIDYVRSVLRIQWIHWILVPFRENSINLCFLLLAYHFFLGPGDLSESVLSVCHGNTILRLCTINFPERLLVQIVRGAECDIQHTLNI